MKQKIKEALQQGYKNLGLSEEVFERVTASVETFITDEADIDKYVNSELVKNLMKFEQSDADRKRAKRREYVKPEGEDVLDNGNKPEVPKQEAPNLSEMIAKAVAAAFAPVQEEMNAFKASQSQKSAIDALNEFKNTWDYAKGYPSESADAYEQTMELYEVGGKKWNAEELTAKYKEKLSKAVGKKGVDTTQPFKSEGSGKATPDFSKELDILRAEGVDLPE